MLNYLYKHWSAMCLPIAIYTVLVLAINLANNDHWLLFAVWLQFPVYLLHQFEEHAYPGGFKNYINVQVFHSNIIDRPLSDAGVFWINIPVIWFLFPFTAVLAQLINIQYGLLLPIFGMFNATTHIITALIKREYNPGLLVSFFINYPTGILTLYLFDQAHLLTWQWTGFAFVVSFIIHLILILYVKNNDFLLKALKQKQP